MESQKDVEKVIRFLQNEKGISLTEMMKQLGVERGGFLSWRRSTNKKRRDNLAEKLLEIYAEHFTEGEAEAISATPADTGIKDKYIAYLEKEIERLRFENDRLAKWLENEIKALAAKTN